MSTLSRRTRFYRRLRIGLGSDGYRSFALEYLSDAHEDTLQQLPDDVYRLIYSWVSTAPGIRELVDTHAARLLRRLWKTESVTERTRRLFDPWLETQQPAHRRLARARLRRRLNPQPADTEADVAVPAVAADRSNTADLMEALRRALDGAGRVHPARLMVILAN